MNPYLSTLVKTCASHVLGAALVLIAIPGMAHEYVAGPLKIVHPFASASPPGSSTGALYIKRIDNSSTEDDRLLSVNSSAGTAIQIHSMETTSQGIMKMREVGSLLVKAGAATELGPKSGFHLMLVNLTKALKSGDKISATLNFERAGAISVVFVVESAPSNSHQHATH